jgi:hypothetical protein
MPNNPAPIGLSTYSRLQHLQQTIAALQNNDLAKDSELFVFSDAAKAGDEEKVAAVRSYLQSVGGFKTVNILERIENNRVANNRGGIRMLLDRYGKMIFLEEDVVTAPGFLTFMNHALDKYQGNERIFSISGYCPPIAIPKDYDGDAYLLRRFNAWGFGIWKDRFERIQYISPDDYECFAADKARVAQFISGGGEDMLRMLKADAYGDIDAFDVKAMYAQFQTDQYTVYPTRSLSLNIGMDGTGMHCGPTNKFSVALSDKSAFSLPEKWVVDQRIVRANSKFRRKAGHVGRLFNKLRRVVLGGYK